MATRALLVGALLATLLLPTAGSRVLGPNADGTASGRPSGRARIVQPASPPGVPPNARRPTISRAPQQGHTLTAGHGTWNGGQPQTYPYQWRRCDSVGGSCADI